MAIAGALLALAAPAVAAAPALADASGQQTLENGQRGAIAVSYEVVDEGHEVTVPTRREGGGDGRPHLVPVMSDIPSGTSGGRYAKTGADAIGLYVAAGTAAAAGAMTIAAGSKRREETGE